MYKILEYYGTSTLIFSRGTLYKHNYFYKISTDVVTVIIPTL